MKIRIVVALGLVALLACGAEPSESPADAPGSDGGPSVDPHGDGGPIGPGDGGATDGSTGDAGTDGGSVVTGPGCTSSGFCFEYPAKFGIPLNGVWGASASDAWAVGYSGALLHHDGTDWAITASPTRETLRGIHGRGGSDIWAVGDNVVLHFDGKAWTVVDAGASGEIDAVAAVSADEVWIAGGGAVRRRAAGVWTAMTPPYAPGSPAHLLALDASHVWLTSDNGLVQRWNGTAWSVPDLDVGVGGHAATSLSGTSEASLYACVSQENQPLRKWDGANFQQVNLPQAVRLLALNSCAVESVATNDVWLFGDAGIGHFDGASWTVSDATRQMTIRGSWSSGTAGLAVGSYGRVLKRAGAAWAIQNAGSGSEYAYASSIRAKSGVEWTSLGTALLRRTGGGAWTRTAHDQLEVGGLLPVDATHAWAVSTNAGASAVLYWNGTTFEPKATAPASYWMNQSWQSPDTGEIVFVGESGITSYAGGVFTRLVTVGTYGWVQDIDGVAGSDTWAVGFGGAVWRRKLPGAFGVVAPGTTADLDAVHVVSNSEVYLGGDQSTLLAFNGSTFTPVALPALRFGSRNYRIVLSIDGALSSARGLWVLVSGGEVIELHTGKPPVIHSLHFEGTSLRFTSPKELVVVGTGNNVVRRTLL